jgi:hypothetical protein
MHPVYQLSFMDEISYALDELSGDAGRENHRVRRKKSQPEEGTPDVPSLRFTPFPCTPNEGSSLRRKSMDPVRMMVLPDARKGVCR